LVAGSATAAAIISVMSLEQRLEEIERPASDFRGLTGQTLAVRLYSSAWIHRILPAALALRLAALRGVAEWYLVGRRREEARELTRAIRGVADDRAARRRLAADALRAELQWRPRLYRRATIEGLEHLESARARGRGVILANVHVGPLVAIVHALAPRGVRFYLPGSEWGDAPVRHGLRGRWIVQQNRWIEEAGSRWVPLGGSFSVLLALLARGEVLLFAVDVPGTLEVDLAGRPARVRTGLGALALESGAPVLPIWTLIRGTRCVCTIGEAIDPAGFAGKDDLVRHVVSVVSAPFVEAPEQVHAHVVDVWDDETARITRPKVRR
jgi:lauroyl/myristoyl acyltransferase